MDCYVIKLAGRKRYLAPAKHPHPETPNTGWRPWRWAEDLIDAEKFGSIDRATQFAKLHLGHEEYVIQGVPPAPVPDPVGGTPVMMRMVA
jgi:hypothetical protein